MPLNTSNVCNYQYLMSGRNKGEAVSPAAASRFMLYIGPGFEPGEQGTICGRYCASTESSDIQYK